METPQPPAPGQGGQQPSLPPPSLSYTPPDAVQPQAAPAPPGVAPPPPPPYAPPYAPYPYTTGYALAPAPLDGPAPGLRYADFGIRTAAYLVDAVILAAIALIASPALGGLTRPGTTVLLGGQVIQTSTLNPALILFTFLTQAIYFVGFWSAASRTPGMMVTHLRVLRAADGRPLGIGAAVVRFIGLVIGLWVVFLGVIWVLLDPRRQGWHDKMAASFVVQEVGTQR